MNNTKPLEVIVNLTQPSTHTAHCDTHTVTLTHCDSRARRHFDKPPQQRGIVIATVGHRTPLDGACGVHVGIRDTVIPVVSKLGVLHKLM